ncbi:MAG: S8 family serine peptidase [Calothrix sp. SM1_5_4]|nr:S8 family serine peptidase [Calothrix sp. SM1_5_4]
MWRPGRNIFSTLPNGQHGYMSGTSQATAWVSGIAAGVLSRAGRRPSSDSLIADILETGELSQALKGKTRSGRFMTLNNYQKNERFARTGPGNAASE